LGFELHGGLVGGAGGGEIFFRFEDGADAPVGGGVAGSGGGIGAREFEAAAETGEAAVEVLAGDGGEAADLVEAGVVIGVGFQGFFELGEGFGVFFFTDVQRGENEATALGIDLGDGFGLSGGLVEAAASDAGGSAVKFKKAGAKIEVGRLEGDGTLVGSDALFREAELGQNPGLLRAATVGVAEAVVVAGFGGSGGDGGLKVGEGFGGVVAAVGELAEKEIYVGVFWVGGSEGFEGFLGFGGLAALVVEDAGGVERRGIDGGE